MNKGKTIPKAVPTPEVGKSWFQGSIELRCELINCCPRPCSTSCEYYTGQLAKPDRSKKQNKGDEHRIDLNPLFLSWEEPSRSVFDTDNNELIPTICSEFFPATKIIEKCHISHSTNILIIAQYIPTLFLDIIQLEYSLKTCFRSSKRFLSIELISFVLLSQSIISLE